MARKTTYRTRLGIEIRRTVEEIPLKGAIEPLIEALDQSRGLFTGVQLRLSRTLYAVGYRFVNPPVCLNPAAGTSLFRSERTRTRFAPDARRSHQRGYSEPAGYSRKKSGANSRRSFSASARGYGSLRQSGRSLPGLLWSVRLRSRTSIRAAAITPDQTPGPTRSRSLHPG